VRSLAPAPAPASTSAVVTPSLEEQHAREQLGRAAYERRRSEDDPDFGSSSSMGGSVDGSSESVPSSSCDDAATTPNSSHDDYYPSSTPTRSLADAESSFLTNSTCLIERPRDLDCDFIATVLLVGDVAPLVSFLRVRSRSSTICI